MNAFIPAPLLIRFPDHLAAPKNRPPGFNGAAEGVQYVRAMPPIVTLRDEPATQVPAQNLDKLGADQPIPEIPAAIDDVHHQNTSDPRTNLENVEIIPSWQQAIGPPGAPQRHKLLNRGVKRTVDDIGSDSLIAVSRIARGIGQNTS